MLLFTNRLILSATIYAGVQALCAQNQPSFSLVYSSDSIAKGIEYHDAAKYDSALALYNYVELGDTNYALAQYEKSLSYTALEDHENALKSAQEAIIHSDSANSDYFTAVGNALDDLGQSDAALALYNDGLERFPLSYLLHFNRALTYINREDYQPALADLKRAIEINPFHASSHLQLAQLALNEAQYAQALLSVGYFLMIEPNSGRSNGILALYNKAVSDQIELETKGIKISEHQEDFKKLNLLITSYAALRKDYKYESDIDLGITRQMDLTFKQLAKMPNSKDFWVNYYQPFYQALIAEEQLEAHSYLILLSSASDRHQKVITKNADDIKAFINWATAKLRSVHSLHHEGYQPDNPLVKYWFYQNRSRVEAIGAVKGDDTPHGRYRFYYPDGALNSEGEFIEGEKQGSWTYYFGDGSISFRGEYKDNELDGASTGYHSNGRLQKKATYTGGYYQGITRIYDRGGYLNRYMFHQEGAIEDSLVYFYANGQKSAFLPMAESKLDGEASYYYADGRKSSDLQFEQDNRQGAYTEYFTDGSIATRASYNEGEYHGPYESYYPNGQLKSKGSYNNGARIGKWESYYYDGTLNSRAEYDESGKENGHQEHYARNGLLETSFEYLKGEVKEYRNYDREGNITHQDKRKWGKFWYEGYSLDGVKTVEGNYVGDHKEGLWKYYNDNGLQTSTEMYNDNGELHGLKQDFHYNGELSMTSRYQRDSLKGYYAEYYSNAQLKSEGYYLDNERQGPWYEYYPDGTMASHGFYNQGKRNGVYRIFDPEGQLMRREHYRAGEIYRTDNIAVDSSQYRSTSFDIADGNEVSYYPNGVEIYKLPYKGGRIDGLARWKFANGQLETEGQLINGNRHGDWRWYHPNGQLATLGHYDLGLISGLWVSYYDNGDTMIVRNYENGELHGAYRYYQRGQLLDWSANYDQGSFDGRRIFYDAQGKPAHFRYYDHGRITGYAYLDKNGKETEIIPLAMESGDVKSYFDNGQLERSYQLEKGEFNGLYLEFYRDGSKRSETLYSGGEKNGAFKAFGPKGNLLEETYYVHGNLHGESLRYHPNGRLASRKNYRHDKLHGPVEYYDKNGKLTHRYRYRNGDLYEEL